MIKEYPIHITSRSTNDLLAVAGIEYPITVRIEQTVYETTINQNKENKDGNK